MDDNQEDSVSTTGDNDVSPVSVHVSHVPESPSNVSIVSSENSRSPYTTLATTWTGVSGATCLATNVSSLTRVSHNS